MKVCAVLPAAGLGSRLGLQAPKLLAQVTTDQTVWSILRQKLIHIVDHIHIVASPQGAPLIQHHLLNDIAEGLVSISIQSQPIGMGDAIFCGYPLWTSAATLLVVWADQVHVSQDTLQRTLQAQTIHPRTLTLPLTYVHHPYVEYILDANNQLLQVKQSREGDACNQEGLSDVGTFALSVDTLHHEWEAYLHQQERGSTTDEINFLPFLPFLSSRGWHTQIVRVENPLEARGINTLEDLQFFQSLYKRSALIPSDIDTSKQF